MKTTFLELLQRLNSHGSLLRTIIYTIGHMFIAVSCLMVIADVPFSIAITIVLVLAIDKTVFSFYRRNKSRAVTYIVTSVGVMFMLNGLVRIIIGTDERIFRDGQKFLIMRILIKQEVIL